MQFFIDIGLTLVYFSVFLLLCVWTWRFWKMYVNQKHLNSLKWVLLEIKLPREVTKSPLATEMAIASLLQTGGVGDPLSRQFKGALPAFSSLEIASLEGSIHFYVRIQTKFRSLVEANFYAQYPGVEITEAEDYTTKIHYDHLSKDVMLFGANYRTNASWTPTNQKTGEPEMKGKDKLKMKADFLPIKTYIDYGLDRDPKEENKIDPLIPLLEMMGSIGKGEYFWYQILIQAEGVYDGEKLPKLYVDPDHNHFNLKEFVDARKKQIRTAGFIKHGDKAYNEYGNVITRKKGDVEEEVTYTIKDGIKFTSKKEIELLPEEKEELELINRKLSKPLAACVMRAMYVAKKENANLGENIQKIVSLTKPFAGANSFVPSVTSPYTYDWENFRGRRVPWRGEEKFEEYVEREGFYPHVQIGLRNSLDKWEDQFFWPLTMKHRKMFRMLYEAFFHPFDHPDPAKQVFILNLEEVATLWHLPGATATTPTLSRIDSIKGAPPSNLPI